MRFPGFDGEWERKKLDSISEFINIKIPSESLSIENYISTENILQNFEGITTASSVPSNINVTSFKDGDILMSNIRPYLKKVWKATKAGGCSSDVLVFRKNETCLSEYLYYLIANDNFINYVMIAAKGVKMPRGDKQQIQQYLISLPSICEQQKIAAFLSLIDERISRLTKIIEGLKSLKVAVSKKIFSQEFRFKDENGEDFEEWEEKALGDCLDYEQPTKYLVTSTEYEDTYETPVVTAGKTFILGYTNESTGIFEQDLPVIIFDDFTTSTQFVNFPFKAKSSAMKILKAKDGLNIRFIYEALQMINYEIGGHGRHWISVFEKLEILIPSFPEQAKIGDFLSSIDERTALERSLLQQLKLQKQYLLKQIFI